MDENRIPEMTDANYDAHRAVIAKWLRFLFLSQIASMAVSAFSSIPTFSVLSIWLNRILCLCIIAALFRLGDANDRYRKAAAFQGMTLLCGLFSGAVLSLVGAVCSIVSLFQEYHGHSEIAAPKHPRLSSRWTSLFLWQIMVGILVSLITTLGVVVSVMAGGEVSGLIGLILFLITTVGMLLQILYLIYLHRTLALYR